MSLSALAQGFGISNEGARKAQNRVKEAIHSTEQQLAHVQTIQDEYTTLSATLSSLPEKLSHKIMVPFGPLAFFPGKLVHTNEVLVLLGQNYFVDQTVPKAVAIIDRRKKHLDESKTKLNDQLTSLQNRLQLTEQLSSSLQDKEKGEVVDIREDYNSDEEKKKTKKQTTTKQPPPQKIQKKPKTKEEEQEDDDLFSRLAKLEEQENRIDSGEIFEDDEDEEGEEEEEQDEEEEEEEEDDGEEEEDEEFDLQKEFAKMKLARQQRRDQKEDDEDEEESSNTLQDLSKFLSERSKDVSKEETPTKKKVTFSEDTKNSPFPPGVKVLPNVKPIAPPPFSGNIVEKNIEPLREEQQPQQQAPKKVSRFKASRG